MVRFPFPPRALTGFCAYVAPRKSCKPGHGSRSAFAPMRDGTAAHYVRAGGMYVVRNQNFRRTIANTKNIIGFGEDTDEVTGRGDDWGRGAAERPTRRPKGVSPTLCALPSA